MGHKLATQMYPMCTAATCLKMGENFSYLFWSLTEMFKHRYSERVPLIVLPKESITISIRYYYVDLPSGLWSSACLSPKL